MNRPRPLFISTLLLTLLFPSLAIVHSQPVEETELAFADTDPVATPKAVLVGPTEGQPGDLVDIDGSDSITDFWVWRVTPARFPDGKPTHRIWKDGKGVTLATRAGTYVVRLLVSNARGPADGELIFVSTSPIGPVPPPNPPPPGPTPPPVPVDLATWVRDTASQLVTTDPQRKQTAQNLAKLAREYLKVTTNVTDSVKFAGGWKVLVEGVLNAGGKMAAWSPFFAAFAQKCAPLLTMPEHVKAWTDLAVGLEAIQ